MPALRTSFPARSAADNSCSLWFFDPWRWIYQAIASTTVKCDMCEDHFAAWHCEECAMNLCDSGGCNSSMHQPASCNFQSFALFSDATGLSILAVFSTVKTHNRKPLVGLVGAASPSPSTPPQPGSSSIPCVFSLTFVQTCLCFRPPFTRPVSVHLFNCLCR